MMYTRSLRLAARWRAEGEGGTVGSVACIREGLPVSVTGTNEESPRPRRSISMPSHSPPGNPVKASPREVNALLVIVAAAPVRGPRQQQTANAGPLTARPDVPEGR